MPELTFQTFTRLHGMLKELYGIPSVVNLQSIGGGFTTENFLFSDGQRTFFLKRYNTGDTRRIHDIATAYERFAHAGIPVIQPVKNRQSEYCFFLDEAWWGVFPFVEGISKRSEELTSRDVHELGRMLAEIHLAGQSCPKDDIQPIPLWNKEIFISEMHQLEYTFQHSQNRREVDEIAMENICIQHVFLTEHSEFISSLRPVNNCLIHGDFTQNNVFFDANGHIKATFDLDKTCIAPRAYELARSTLIICFDHAWNETSFSLADIFLRSYLAVHPMSLDEFASGLSMYIANFMHMTWLEKKVIVYQSHRHEALIRSSNIRLKHLADQFDTLAVQLFPKS